MELEKLRRELTAALEKQGVRAESILKGLSCLKDAEQKVSSMERMAMEMQNKVIHLQQERDTLEEQLMRGAPFSITAEVERRQNLELKDEITRLAEAREKSRSENSRLSRQLEESETLCIALKEQLKELLGPTEEMCSSKLLGSNKTDLEKAGKDKEEEEEEEQGNQCVKKAIQHDHKWTQTKEAEDSKRSPASKEKSQVQTQTCPIRAEEDEALQEQLKTLEAENVALRDKMEQVQQRGSPDSSSDEDDPFLQASTSSTGHKSKQKVKTLERQLQVLHSENTRLAEKLGGYSPWSTDEMIERIMELEDQCADLQERVHEAEGHERQMREKLRMAEQTINELELSEAQYRDRCDELSSLEKETKKQLHNLVTTGRELREIIMDKDIVEQSLREKVEFLEKVEAQSSQRINELEATEKSLREQLEARDAATDNGADHHLNHGPSFATLQEKLAAAVREVHQLKDHNSELEENEEILRENWRRVADEDANRIMCLEEKVRMLEQINLDLKGKLSEAQDFVVINSGPPTQRSLAEELSASTPKRPRQARPHCGSPIEGGSDEDSGDETPQVSRLQRQLSIVKEEKNAKIANLQERVAKMKENEIKLSETLAEMEMTERELRAKLALYESSEVTVEKMLKYQDKIHELRTSQESLLDQLETMESQEVTLQEQLEETERRYKGKIVTLEVEMKNLKQKELKANARVRELEKHETELTEKTKIQSEKENGLYVRISGLMDQLKEQQTKVSSLEKKLEEKDERCRKIVSLEAKFFQIEGAYKEKVTSLETALAEAQTSQAEERQQAEEAVMALGEQVATLEASLETQEKEQSQRVFILQEMFAQKEKGLDERIALLEKELADKETTFSTLEAELAEKDSKISKLEEVVCSKASEGSELEKNLSTKDSRISDLEEDLNTKNSCISKLEQDLSTKDSHIGEVELALSTKDSRISKLEVDLNTKFNRISELEEDLSTKYNRVGELEEDISERDLQINKLEEALCDKDLCIREVEKDLHDKEIRVVNLERELSEKRACVSDLEKDLAEKASYVSELERDLKQKESQISEAEKDLNKFNEVKGNVVQKDKHIGELERVMKNQTSQINEMEISLSEKESCIKQQSEDLAEKQSQIEQLKKDIREKCTQVQQLGEDLSSKEDSLCEAEKNLRDRDSCVSQLESDIKDKNSQVHQLKAKLVDRECQIRDLETQLEAKCKEHSEGLEQVQQNIASKDTDIAQMEERVVDMSSTISQLQATATERDSRLSDLEKQLADKDTVISEHVSQLQMEMSSKQKSSTDKISSLEEELVATKAQLSQLDARLSESFKQLDQVQIELEDERKKVLGAIKSKEELEAERDHLLSEVTSLKCDFEARMKELNVEFQEQMSERVSEFHQMHSSLEAECESLRKEQLDKNLVIENLESKKNDLLSKIENLKDRERDLNNRLSMQEEEMKCTVSELEHGLKDSEQEKQKVAEKQAGLEAEVHSLNQTIERQTEEITRLKSDLQEARSEAQKLQEKLTELQQQEINSSRQADTLLQQEAILKAQVAQAEAQLEAKSKNLDQQKHGTVELEQQKQNLEAALLQVQTDLSDSHILNAHLQEKLSELTLQTTFLREEVANLTAELQTHLTQEENLQEMLDKEKSHILDLESQLGSLKDEKKSALAKVEQICSELLQSQETVEKQEKEIITLNHSEDALRAEILTEQTAKKELEEKLSQVAEETNFKQEKVSQLELVAIERDEEIQRMKADLLSQSQQLESQKLVKSSIEEKDKELLSMQQREKSLREKITLMENQMCRHQEDHSHMCQKLQELEKREKELLEQMTDIEQTVIVPLETENTELKEEVQSIKQQNDSLNLQIDKHEERAKEDFEELEGLRDSVINLQLTRTELQSKLDTVTKELSLKDVEKETMESRVIDLETRNKNLEEQLENNRVELDKIELEFNKEMCSRDAQTELDVAAMEAKLQSVQNKLTVLQDAEDKFMSRILDLEEREQHLTEQLESARQHSHDKEVCAQETQTETEEEKFIPQSPVSPGTVDACVYTDGIQEANVTKVPELFARVQELESANQQLLSSMEQAAAEEIDRKQLTDKLHLLEQSEDRLMERVMELEEAEIMLRTQVDRFRHRAKAADELEEEVSVLLQQEDELKEKVTSLTSHNSSLSKKLETLQSQLAAEHTKNESLSHQIQTEDRQLQDTQKELRLVHTKLQAVRSEYEEKLSALEKNEKKIENQLDTQSQHEGDLRQEIRVLKEEMEDVCERYKELELENSTLKQQHSKVLMQLKETESRCLKMGQKFAEEPATIQVVQAATSLSAIPQVSNVSHPGESNIDQQQSSPQVCSINPSNQMVQSSLHGAQNIEYSSVREESLLDRISQLEKELSNAQRKDSSVQQSRTDSSEVHSDSNLSDEVQPPPSLSVKILTLPEALKENASLKAQLQDLTSILHSSTLKDSEDLGTEEKGSTTGKQSAEISHLQARVAELEESLAQAEGAVQEVVTVIRTRSVHTLEQKIETIMHTIHTQSPTWPLHQELLELLTSQADLQKQVSHLMETEHNLRLALKQTEDELSRVKSGTGPTTLSAGRRLSVQSRLSRFGGGVTSKASATNTNTSHSTDTTSKEKQQWLERQVADLQLAKNNLERRLHEAERRLAFRPRPTAASKEEVQFRVEQLQEEQAQWRHKVEDLEALNSHYLKEKLELAQERNALENKLQEQGQSTSGKDLNPVFVGDTREEPLGSSGSVSEGESTTPADTMLEKPEDVLHKRISELENLETYLKQQLSEVESDREQLHEITRKDKATIHQQNVRLRELMLTERNLRSQVSGLEDSERSLYNRCSELEDTVARLEDRVHELEVHERRLRELVRKLKLDEEVWLSKSGDLASSMELLSSSEVTLRKTVHDLQIQRGGLSDRAEHLEARVKELETLEASLVQRLKNYENVEASLQGRLRHLENSEAAALSKASELDVINMDLSSRLQRAVEENAVLSQHVAQQQGQIHELDRKLTAAADAEVGLVQHVDSLQKNEGSLQKKVREYELKEIDAQARVRELEQTEEILKDKINQLQRSENRLKARLVEFESVGSQMLENLVPAQKQQLPQNLEECQKRVVVLQRELETAQAELHQRPQLQSASHDATTVKVPTAALSEMRAKVALLEDAEYQLNELEKLNAQLSQNILQLQQGKGSCGHEVELEVLKKRLQSSQNLIKNLKHHLSEGQVPSLLAADAGQGLESEDLPGHNLQCLESERVLHSVRSLTKPPGLAHTHEEIIQPQSSSSTTLHALRAHGVAATPSEPEESHWRRVELRTQQQGSEQRGASASMPHTSAATTIAAVAATPRQEELMIGLSLASESERGSQKSQNDTDSEMSGALHHPNHSTPHTVRVGGSTPRGLNTGAVPSPGSPRGTRSHPPPMPTSTPPFAHQKQQQSGFVKDDSFYLPSPGHSESESLEGDSAPPLPSSAPPTAQPASVTPPQQSSPLSRVKLGAGAGATTTPVPKKVYVSAVPLPTSGQSGADSTGAGDGRTSSVMGLSIRQRIAQIESHLKEKPSSKAGSKTEDDVFTWKAKVTENARLLGIAERESKQLKEDLPPATRRREKINKLEKDLEEKRRCIDIFEKWILDAEEVLKNKNKKNDRDLVQQLQTEVKHLKQDLANAGCRKDDIFSDPAALKTELDHRERELITKQSELESVIEQVKQWQLEYSNVESMRRNALDSLRLLETEVTQLQDADIQLKQMKDDYNTLRGQYEDVWNRCKELNQTLSEKDDLEFTLKRTILERDHLKCDLDKVTQERDVLEPQLHELRGKVRDLSNVKAENTSLELQVSNMNTTLKERTQKVRDLYEENMNLHERFTELQHRLDQLRETRRDLDNMCARYDEVDMEKNKAVAAVHSLRAKVARLSSKCQEKDELLRRLSLELRGGRGRSVSLLEELTRLETMAAGEEYNRPMSPLDLIAGPASSVDAERLLSERIPQATTFTRSPSSSSLGDPYDPSTGSGNDKSSLRRPKSAEHARKVSNQSSAAGVVGNALGHGRESHYVAILDYQPETASRSGHRNLELPLKEGDQVRVRGPVDRHGYCEAEVGGRTGLVPASHLYPITDSAATHRQNYQLHGLHKKSTGDSAEQIVQMFDDFQDHRLLSGAKHNHAMQASAAAHSATTQTRQRRSQAKNNAAPEAPSNLHIKEVEGNSLVLAWQPPTLDQQGCSNGSRVVGYRIYLNGRVCQQPHNPRLSHTRVEGVRHDRPQQLAIQTLAASGQLSARVELVYQGLSEAGQGHRGQEDQEADTDLSSVLNSIHYKTGKKRMMMGLYDYDPEKQSPGDYAACELAFHAGDILTVYGEERQDGFFHGERNGQRGLVPACFVEPVTQGAKSAQKHSPANGSTSPGGR